MYLCYTHRFVAKPDLDLVVPVLTSQLHLFLFELPETPVFVDVLGFCQTESLSGALMCILF